MVGCFDQLLKISLSRSVIMDHVLTCILSFYNLIIGQSMFINFDFSYCDPLMRSCNTMRGPYGIRKSWRTSWRWSKSGFHNALRRTCRRISLVLLLVLFDNELSELGGGWQFCFCSCLTSAFLSRRHCDFSVLMVIQTSNELLICLWCIFSRCKRVGVSLKFRLSLLEYVICKKGRNVSRRIQRPILFSFCFDYLVQSIQPSHAYALVDGDGLLVLHILWREFC